MSTKTPAWYAGQIVFCKLPRSLRHRFKNGEEARIPARVIEVVQGDADELVYRLQRFPPRPGDEEVILDVQERDIDARQSSRSAVTGRGSWLVAIFSLCVVFIEKGLRWMRRQ